MNMREFLLLISRNVPRSLQSLAYLLTKTDGGIIEFTLSKHEQITNVYCLYINPRTILFNELM